ncbi:uncharacterized protein [Primulina huaijiensis]|uniref:uncharacterized protein n=1 Tax=Primulina huaijiensis TaxID=1492673 RepID=UPI003CC79424
MPRSAKHKSHRQSKHSSRDYSDSEEDVKMKDKSSKDDNLVKVSRDSAYGEKRIGSSQIREGKEVENIIEHENGGASENYFSSKRRKENSNFGVGGDRWSGGDNEIGKSDRVMVNETTKMEAFKVESKSNEFINKGNNSRNRSKKYESGSTGEKNESLGSVVVEEEEGKSKTESKRKSERDYSVRKEGKESEDKDRSQEKEKGQERNRVDEAKLADVDVAKRTGLQQVDLIVERQLKRVRENSDFPVRDESRNSEFEKELEKRTRRRREGSSDWGKHHDAFKDGEERGFTSRTDRVKDLKYRDEKHKDEIYADKCHEDNHKDDRQRDEKYHKETSKDNKYRSDKHRTDGEKDGRRREDRHRGDDDKENRNKDERHREDEEKDTKWRYDKYREGTESDSRNRDDRRHEDGERDRRRRDDRYREDGSKKGRHGDERYYEDGDKDRRGSNSHKEDSNRDIRHKEEKHREDVERESRHKDSKQGSDFDRGKNLREAKYRDERASRDRSVDKSDLKHSIDDVYAADYHSRKSSAYDYSPTHDERTARNRDDQGIKRPNEKGDFNDIKSQTTNGQRFEAQKGGSKIDSTPNRGRSASRNADVEINSSHSRRRSSPSSSSLAPRDRYRLPKQDESKYRDYGYEERHQHNLTSTRDYNSAIGGSEKTSLSWSKEKQVQKEDGHLGGFGERCLKSDSRSSPTQLTEKSPPTSIDRRQFSRSDVRRSIDVEESTQRSGGSRDVNEYSGKEGRGRHESVMDMFPGNELSQADADTVSGSSPFMRNRHLSGSSKSFPPPPHFRTGVESPLIGSGEDDSRFKSNSRHRRSGDPNMGRAHGNAWRGVPSWPSPVVNGFMPFPHAPPPVNFHSVMQPFQTPLFGIRPSVDTNHSAPFHMRNTEIFSGPGRPMGWRNPVDDHFPPLHAWDARNASLRDESHIYGRPGWDHSRNLPDGQGWDTTGDLWKGPNRTVSLEMSSSELENNFTQNADEVSASQSIRQVWNEQTFPGQQAESNDVNQSNYGSENNAVKTPQIIPEDTGDAAKISKKDDVLLCHVYLSKLDISADLTEPDLFNQCSGFCNMDQIIVSDIDDSKILFIEEAGEARVESHQILRYFLPTPKDDSVFMRAMSLYERQKDSFDKVVAREKFSIPESHQEGPDAEDNTAEKQSSVGDILSAEDGPALVNTDVYVNPMNTLLKVEGCTEATHEKPILPVAVAMVKSEEPVSTLEIFNMQVDLASNLVLQDHIVQEKHLPVGSDNGLDTSLPANMENDGNIEELNLDGTECVTLLNSDLFSEVSEAMMPESLVSGSVNLSRIHHSPESTH